MGELESKPGVYSLSFERNVQSDRFAAADFKRNRQLDRIHYRNFVRTPTDSNGTRTDAIVREMVETKAAEEKGPPPDLHKIDLLWVDSTKDPLFRDLTRQDRHLLYMVLAREMTWKAISEVLDVDPKTARKRYRQILASVQQVAAGRTKL
jgi:hypothetical protein